MKANELRIGNKIYGNYQSEIDRGNGIVEDIECQDIVTFEGYDPIDNYFHISYVKIYDSFEPIPLTEEWLLKFGFKQQIGYSKLVNDRYSFEIAWNDVGKWYAFFRNFNKGKQDDFVTLKNNLKYVHQLQNLYFALTGEELKIKE